MIDYELAKLWMEKMGRWETKTPAHSYSYLDNGIKIIRDKFDRGIWARSYWTDVALLEPDGGILLMRPNETGLRSLRWLIGPSVEGGYRVAYYALDGQPFIPGTTVHFVDDQYALSYDRAPPWAPRTLEQMRTVTRYANNMRARVRKGRFDLCTRCDHCAAAIKANSNDVGQWIMAHVTSNATCMTLPLVIGYGVQGLRRERLAQRLPKFTNRYLEYRELAALIGFSGMGSHTIQLLRKAMTRWVVTLMGNEKAEW